MHAQIYVLCMTACTCMPTDGNNELGRPITSFSENFKKIWPNLAAWWLKEHGDEFGYEPCKYKFRAKCWCYKQIYWIMMHMAFCYNMIK